MPCFASPVYWKTVSETLRKNSQVKENQMPNEYGLTTRYDARKSFYEKARVRVDNDGNKFLISYGTPVMWWDAKTKNLHRLCAGWTNPKGKFVTWSSTTGRHITEFSRQMEGCVACFKKEWDMMEVEDLPHPLSLDTADGGMIQYAPESPSRAGKET